MTKMAATPIYGKNAPKIFFSGTGGLISTKLCIYYREPLAHHSLFIDDTGLALTYFMARSNLVT